MSIRRLTLTAGPMRCVWPFKAPAEILDYAVDWSQRLAAGDKITESDFTLPPGIVATKSSNTDTLTEVWISEGEAGQVYPVQNRIRTAAGRTMDQTIKLKVKAK